MPYSSPYLNKKSSSAYTRAASPVISATIPKNVVFLTDSWTHNDDDTIFPMALHLAQSQSQGPLNIYVLDRAAQKNKYFFDAPSAAHDVYGYQVTDHYDYDTAVHYCVNQRMLTPLKPHDIDAVFMMMDQPISQGFLKELPHAFPKAVFTNNPVHACYVGDKSYLDLLYNAMPDVRPYMPRTSLCTSINEIDQFAMENGGNIILKTLNGYGGNGVKRYGNACVDADIKTTEALQEFLYQENGTCIAMQRLHHPQQEDNRLIVVNGQIVGALRRTAAEGQFLCNMSVGGQAALAQPEEDEINLVRALYPILEQYDLRFVGIDTLRHIDPATGQQRRLLSEINTLNTGGLSFMNELTGRHVLEAASEMLISSMLDQKHAGFTMPQHTMEQKSEQTSMMRPKIYAS